MSLTLNSTAAHASANSYASRAEADTYHDAHLFADTGKSAEAWKKDAALIWATRLLDEQVQWYGAKQSVEQALQWPRIGVLTKGGDDYFDNLEIPKFLKEATAELARYLISEDRTAERGYGIKKVKADVVEVEFDSFDSKPILPPSVKSIVGPFGAIEGPGSGFARLIRH